VHPEPQAVKDECTKCPLNGKSKIEGCGVGGGGTMLIGEAPGATEVKVGKPIEGFTPEEVARDSTENREGRAKTCNSCKTSHVEAHKTTPKKTSSRTSTGTDIDKYNIGSKLHGTTNCDKCPLNKQPIEGFTPEEVARDSTENEEEHATARNSRNQPHVKAQKATLNETSSLSHTGTDISKYNIGSKLHGTGNVNCDKCPFNGKVYLAV
jgi:hypothetical protein